MKKHILFLITLLLSIFAFTNSAHATRVVHITADDQFVSSSIYVDTCPEDLNIKLYVDGNDVIDDYDTNGFYANNSCTQLLLPESSSVFARGNYNNIVAWYDNPNFIGEPVSIIDYNPNNPSERIFYGKTGQTVNIYIDGYKSENLIVGRTYSVTGIINHTYYSKGIIDNSLANLYNNYPASFYSNVDDFTSNNKYFKNIDNGYNEYVDHTDLSPIIKESSCNLGGDTIACYTDENPVKGIFLKTSEESQNTYEITGIIDEYGNSYGTSFTIDSSMEGRRFYTITSNDEICIDKKMASDPGININYNQLNDSIYANMVSIKKIETTGTNPNYFRFDNNGSLIGYNTCISDDAFIKVKYDVDPSLINAAKVRIYFEDGTEVEVNKGSTYILPSSVPSKSATLTTVRFKYQDGATSDTTSPYTTTYTPYRFNISGINYAPSSQIIANEDMYVSYAYNESYSGAQFPEPTRTNYTFAGWFDAATGGNIITTYSDAINARTLYAHWVENDKVSVTRPDGITISLYKGSSYTIPDIPSKSNTIVSRVLFRTLDSNNTTNIAYVTKTYTKNGVTINGTHYDVGQTITVNDNIVITPNYTETIVPATFPSDPTKPGATFKGWYTSNSGGTKYTSYNGSNDLILYGQYDLVSYSLSFAVDASTDYPYEIDYSTATYSKNNIHYGDTFTTPAITEYSQEGWCYINCESTNIDTYSDLNWYLSSKNTWKPKVRLHYMDENDTVKEFTDNVLWLDNRKTGFIVNYYDSENNQTVRDELDFGTTYTFNYNQNLQEIWTNHTSGNIKNRLTPYGSVLNIPSVAEPGRNGNPIPDGYEFIGWYTAPTGGTLFNVEDTRNQFITLAQSQYIFENAVDENNEIVSKIKDFTGFDAPDYYARYAVRQITVTKYDNNNTPTVEVYDYGTEYNLGTNNYIYNNILYDAKVTFVHADQTEESGYVAIGKKANGWLIGSTHYDNNTVITLVDDITISPDKTEVKTSPEFPATQNGYGWYTESGERLIGYTGIKDITLYEMPSTETYEIIFGVETNGPYGATNPDFSTLTYSKNDLHYGDTFQVPSLNEYPEEDFCFTHCYKNKYNAWFLTSFFSEDGEWKPELYLHYMDDDDTVKDASHDTLYLQTKKKKLRLYYEEYDSSRRLINTVDRYLEYGGTYTFDYNRNLYDVGLQQDGGTNSYERVNIHRVGEPMGIVVEIPEHYNPDYETNDVEIPEGYEFDGWYTEPNGQGEKYSYEAFKYKYLDKATVADIYYATVDDLEDKIIKEYDTTNFTGFEPIHLYAHYVPKQTTTHTVTYPNGDIYEVEDGQTHTLLSNNESKASENIATVTFKYSDNRLPDATSYVQKTYMPNEWLIGDTNYAAGTDIVVNEDIVLVPDFVETTIGATFPEVVDNDYYRSEWRTASYCGGGSLVTSYNGTSDVTYYESYKRVLHFDEDNGTPIYTKTFCENDYLLCSDALGYAEKDGTYFNGWTLYIDGEDVAYYDASQFDANGGPGSELYFDSYYLYNNEGYALAKADYSLMSYYISYNLNGGTVSGNPRSYTIEDEITLNNPTKEGFEFAGWGGTGLTGTNNMTVTIPAGSTGDRSYTAYWSTNKTITLGTNDIDIPDEVLATVTFNPHNGDAITTSDVIKTYTPNGWLVNGKHYVDGETIIVPIGSIAVPNFVERIIPAIYPNNPTKDGYEFEGWYDATEGNKVSAYSGNEDITLHARYTDNYAYLDVNFNFNQKLLDLVTSDEVKNFRKATLEEYNDAKDEFSNGNDITGAGSPKRVYMWKNGKDILYYSDADVIYFPEDSSEYFAYIPYLRVLDISGLNTSKVINMTSMFERNEDDFYNKYRFTEINLSNFDTHNVTSMSRMFYGQAYLKEDLDVSNFDTHNVIDMSGMFHLNGKTVDISNFDTSNVTNMSGMFNKFHGDDAIGIENLDTSKVTNMSYMFNNSHFYNLDLSGWDVSNVTNMEYMFDRAAYLANVDVSTWDVSKVEKMTHMFYYDFNLNVLDLRSWDTSNVVYTAEMFARCRNLNTIYVSDKWNMDSVLYGNYMFDEDNSIVGEKGTTYDESNIDFDYAHIDDAPTNPGYLSERLYETPKYIITFDGGEYFPTTSRLADAGTPIGNMPTNRAVYNNYGEITFGGWYTDQTYTTEVTPDFIPTGDITFYAKPICSLGYSGDAATEGTTEIVGLVTFEPHNGEPATTSFIYKEYRAIDKWLVDGQIYKEYDSIVLYPNISIEPYYEGEVQEVFFPTRLTYVGHNFLGWFTEEEGGTQLTSYNQEESITLHAHWERNGKNICTYSNGKIEECEAGKSYQVPSNEYVKIGKVSEIVNGYGAYENAVYNTYDIYAENIINSYEIDGILYYPGDNYVINGDTYITVDGHRSYVSTVYLDSYVDVEVDSEWFDGEEKYFLGWFTEPIGGEQIITYNGAESINVYAHYYDNPDDAVLLTFNGIQDSYEIRVLKGTEFTPYDAGEEYTAYFRLDYQDGRPLVPGYQREYNKPTGFTVNGRVIDVGDTVVINEDTLVTTLSDGYKKELSDFETPYKEGYIFKGWYDAPEDGNFANFNSEDFYVYTDTYYAQYAPYNSEEDVTVDFDGEKFVYPRGTVLTLPDDREKEGKYFYADFYDGKENVGYVSIETTYTLRNFTVNNVEYDIGADITLNEDTVIRSNFDEVPNYDDYTLDQYPDLVYPNFPDFGLGDTFYGWFDKPNGGKQYYDASELAQEGVKLYAIYTDGNQIPITVDGVVIIVDKGLGNLPNSKNKDSENIAEITFDYNKEGYTNETAYITKDYTFDHFTIDGEGNYMPNQEYNFTHSIVINSVYTESYNYPEIPTVTNDSFQGWYTNQNGGDLVTSLEGIISDTTLYANWDNNGIIVCVNNNCNEVPEGTIYNLGQNTESKDADIISTVTFAYNNGQGTTTSNVTRQYIPNGWLVNGVHYDDNADITILQETEIEPDFVDAIVGAPFPEDPEGSETATFIGWSVADPLDLPRGNQFTYCSDDELCDDFITSYNYTEDIYLDAIYTVTYTLVCDPENPQVDGTYTIDFRDGSTIVFPNMNTQPCSKQGYEFYGFRGHQNGNEVYHLYVYDFDYLGNGFFGISTDDYTLPVEVNPIYRLENYDITLNLAGGYFEDGYTPNYYTIEDDDTEIPNPVKDGYTFVGWIGEGITEPTKNLIIPSGSYGDREYTAVFGENYILTYPDGTEETIYEGQVITLPTNTESKDDDYVSTVYFYDYASDDSNYYETISEQDVFKSYIPNGWLIDDVHYDNEQEITVIGDIYLEPDYNETLSDVTIPTENNLEHYTFNGWYEYEEGSGSEVDAAYINDYLNDGYEVYAYAYRIGEELTITTPNGIEVVNYGDEVTLPVNDIAKVEDLTIVTFVPNNGEDDYIAYVTQVYTPNGWLINGIHYDDGATYTVTENHVRIPDYTYEIIPATFPNDPVKENYNFEGWYSGEDRYTSYALMDSLVLTARWKGITITETDPEGNEIEHNYGDEVTLSENDMNKLDETANVTFVYGNGSNNTYSSVVKKFTPNGWLINGVHYDNGAIYTVTEDFERVPDYTYEIIPAEFPSNPTKENYTFDGWFNGEDKYTSYSELQDITLTAKWTGNTIIEIDPEGGEIPHNYGDEITLPTNDIAKSNTEEAIVTFVYGNGNNNTTSTVEKQYTPNGWLINGVHYDNGATYTVTEDYERIPDYTFEIIPAEFPSNPTKENYTFEGWFNENTKYTSYSELQDITLTAKWTGNTIIEIDPEGGEIPHNYGDEITLPTNDIAKSNTEEAIVTFVYGNGNNNTTSTVEKQYTPNGWLINGVHYDNGTTYTVTEDYERIPDYIETIVPAVFPSNPTKENYTFDGWFNGNTKYTSYSELQDIILTAKWTGESIQVCILNECEEVPYGTEIDLGENNEPKESTIVSTVTFKYHNGEDDTTSDVIKTYTPSGWFVNGAVKADNEVITITGTTVIERNYIEVIVGAIFPSDPEKEHYTFNGWFDSEENGTKYTSYNEESDITLHAIYVGEDVTITTPNGDITVHYGDEYELPENDIAKDNEVIATVTFKPQNGDEDATGEVIKTYIPNGWLIGDIHYSDKAKITVTEDIVVIPDYEVESVIPAIFPDDPEKEHYVFNGWFDREEEGTKYTEYDGEDDLILFAQYIGEDITITTPNGDITVHYGDEYELPENNIAKDSEIISTVTFKYYNEEDDTTSNVLRTYTPNGWLIDGTHYDDKITVTKNITLVPDYIENVVPAQFPNNPEKIGHAFVGWYDAIEEGTMYTEYNGENDITLHARWEMTGPTDIELDVNDLLIVKDETHQIVITTTPVDAIASYTYTGYDNEIITVSNTGLITAISEGETTITVSVVDSDITKQMTVTVLDNQITSDVYTVTNKDLTGEDLRIIIGAEPETTIDEFLNNVNNDRQYIEVYNKDDELVSSEEYESTFITTGSRLKLVIDNHEYDNVIVIIRGDLNKDGKINILDSTKMNNHIMKKSLIEDYVIYAANIVEREDETMETAINVMDSSELNKYILKKIDTLNERDGD